jgi:transcriptional regulator with XRE-family HTH domain
MDDRGLTQTNVAKTMGLNQPDISRLLKGQFREVSVERILKMLSRLGCEIDIVEPERAAPGHPFPSGAGLISAVFAALPCSF